MKLQIWKGRGWKGSLGGGVVLQPSNTNVGVGGGGGGVRGLSWQSDLDSDSLRLSYFQESSQSTLSITYHIDIVNYDDGELRNSKEKLIRVEVEVVVWEDYRDSST